MFWLAMPVVAVAWAVQFADAQPLAALPAWLWGVAALLAWCLFGARAALVVLAAGWTLCRADWLLATHYPAYMAGRDVLVTGSVCDFARTDTQAARFVLDADAGMPLDGMARRIHLGWYDQAPEIRPGQRWQLLVRLRPPRGLANPGAFDFEQWLYTRQVSAVGYVRKSVLNRPLSPSSGHCLVAGPREMLARRIEAVLGSHAATGYVLGVVVGATNRLAESDWELLRRTGTTHLLAISGMNIVMVAAPFVLAGPLLGRLLPILAGRPMAGPVAGLVAAAAYSALSGFAIATVRALVMLGVATALATRRRRISGVDLLGSAALVMVVVDPAALVSVSFWLSFLAVAWLYVLAGREPVRDHATRRPGRWHRWIRPGVALGHAQVVLGLGLAPLTLGWFQQLSLVAPLTNLLAVPVFTLAVMPLALVGSVLELAVPGAGALFLHLAADVVGLLLAFLNLAGASDLAIWRPPAAGWAELLLCAAAAVVLCWWRPLPWRSCAVVLLVPLVFGVRHPPAQLTVTVMDVGQGLAVLVETPNHSLLYDAGPAFRLRDAGESVVLPVMRHAGTSRLDLLMLSHDDLDHRGGADAVLDAFPQAPLVAPLRPAVAAVAYLPCQAGLAWNWDGVWFRVISPARSGAWTSDNDGSCVLRVDAARASVLLPGDIEQSREAELQRRGLLQRVDLLLGPHHGSRTSSSAALVGSTQPRFVVFSAGHLNRWGFPAPEVTRRWEEAGACVLNTATSGALVFATDEDGELRLLRRQRADGAHLWMTDVERGPACAGKAGA